ncbi:predicted protein [Thalassiosira pseudonana CCMP1335]|uniref:Uncharacterized protein n=1 Tax=Thalassiosira pseudonana TaxID=35128 RepID=B8CF73_THAPS|nr:predicted protein [Thalassiosira pseudonana CCMP1335]EED87578.1 predicted protein [Thalassiosira pseudonana CCMP1335]
MRKESFHARYGRHDDDDDEEEEDGIEDEETFIDRAMGSSHYRTSMRERQLIEYLSEEDPKVVLFRHLLREWFAGGETMEDATTTTTNDGCKESATRKWSMDEEGFIENGKVRQVPLMRFPSQIIDGGGLSLRQLIQREFRAPTAEQRLAEEALTLETSRGKSTPHNNKKPLYPPSSMQTAFYTLMELNRKLAWAEKIGFPPPTRQQQLLKNESLMKELEQRRNWKRLVQAASGVSRFPHKTIDARGESNSLRMEEAIVASDTKASPEINTNPLQCGSFLIAHPLMTGYFAKSVILLLDHTEASSKSTSSTESQAESEEVGSGGTYGLIINRLALQPVSSEKRLDIIRQRLEEKKLQQQSELNADGATPTASKSKSEDATSVNLMRPITLLQAINASDLPEPVQEAFGDAPVREGGPVNLSLQMIHRKCLDVKKSRGIGGKKQVEDVTFTSEEVEVEEATTETVGGTLIPSLLDNEDGIDTEAFYFGGDVIRASLDVSEGIEDQDGNFTHPPLLYLHFKDDFSFIIGASCWAPGQLEKEIERGCWLPFRGDPSMALTGECDHNDVATLSTNDGTNTKEETKKTKLSMFPPRPSNTSTSVAGTATIKHSRQPVERPVGDLWLSIMCALGKEEAELAYMLLENKNVLDELGDTCDNVER